MKGEAFRGCGPANPKVGVPLALRQHLPKISRSAVPFCPQSTRVGGPQGAPPGLGVEPSGVRSPRCLQTAAASPGSRALRTQPLPLPQQTLPPISAPLGTPGMKQGGQAARPSQTSGRKAENGPLNRGSPAPPPAERSVCSSAPAPSCGSPLPLGTAAGAQESSGASPSKEMPRRLSARFSGARGQTWRISSYTPKGPEPWPRGGALWPSRRP